MTPPAPSRLLTSLWPAAVALVLLVAIVPYAGGYEETRKAIIGILSDRWFASESTTWQYGAIVPFVVAWLVWRKREILTLTKTGGSSVGLVVTVGAMFCYFVGYRANNYYFGYLAIQLFVMGAVIWQLGWSWMRQLAFPWLVLGTAWPLYFLEDRLGFPLRMLSTKGVMVFVKLLHLPVVAEGTSLFSASAGEAVGSWMTLKIDGPCSGMNTLFALMFIALLFAHHQQPTLVRRSLLFALSIPLAIIGNMVRIGMLIAGCRLFGQDFAVGNHENEMSSFHLLAGLAVFVVAFIGLQTASSQMNRWLSKRKASPRSGSPATPRDQAPAHPSTLLRSSITLIIAAITAALCTQLPPPTGSQDVGVVMQLPQRVGPLAGIPREPDKIEKERLPTDTSFAKMSYVTANSAPAERDIAQVSVVLAGAESRSIHRPEVCLTGQGWSIDGAKVIPVEISPGRTLFVKDLSISGTFPSNDGKARRQRAHYVYWFAGHGVTTPSHFERLWRSTWDAVLHNVNHRWAYAAVMAHVTENFDPEECGERRRTDEQTERLITFLIQNLVPQFQKDFFVEGKPAIVN